MTNPADLAFAGLRGGRTKSAGTPSPNAGPDPKAGSLTDAGGLTVCGVVMATYVQLDTDNPAFPDKTIDRVVGVYCDVLTYSSRPHLNGKPLARVLVADSTGMHTGRTWRPRATTMDIKNGPLQAGMRSEISDPRNLDGDHVLIQFLDNNTNRPIITGRIPHPQTGLGNEDLPQAGHRQRLKLVDGSPDLFKHNGTFYGVDDKGGFIIDTTRAHKGAYNEDGTEDPQSDGITGDVTVRVKKGQSVTIEGVDPSNESPTNTFLIHVDDADVHLRLQDSNSSIRIHRDLSDNDIITLDVDDAAGDAHLELKKGMLTVTMEGAPNKSMVLNTLTGHWTLKLGGASVDFAASDGDATMTLGGSAATEFGVLFTALDAWWQQQAVKINAMQTDIATLIGAHNALVTAYNAHLAIPANTAASPGTPTTPPTATPVASSVTVNARSPNLRLPPV